MYLVIDDVIAPFVGRVNVCDGRVLCTDFGLSVRPPLPSRGPSRLLRDGSGSGPRGVFNSVHHRSYPVAGGGEEEILSTNVFIQHRVTGYVKQRIYVLQHAQ